MPIQADLIAAVQADPDDLETQLVLADWLQSIGDERGELIALDLRDRSLPGGLTEPDALERLLALAAEYGFPNARDPRPAAPGPEGTNGVWLQHDFTYADHHYCLRWVNERGLELAIEMDGDRIDPGAMFLAGLTRWQLHRIFSDGMPLLFEIVSDAIRAGTPLMELVLPFGALQLPAYPGAVLRGYALPVEFTQPRGLARDRYGLAARDYHRWHAIWNRLGRM